MNWFLSLTLVCSSVASALSLSSHPLEVDPVNKNRNNSNHDCSKDILTAVGASSSSEVSLSFEAPCHGCFGGADDRLVFHLAIHSATNPCGEGHIVINDQKIEWSHSIADGAATVHTHLASGSGSRDLNATWNAACVAGDTQVLSFHIHQGDQNPVQHDAGFTFSFTQQSPPTLLRLAGVALDIGNLQDVTGHWRHPDQSHRFTLAPNTHTPVESCLHQELRQLHALRTKSQNLQKAITKEKHKIYQLLRADFADFRSAIQRCSSLKCIFRTTTRKLPEYARIFSAICMHTTRLGPPVVAPKEEIPFEGIRKQGNGAIINHGPETSPDSDLHHDELDGSHRAPTSINQPEHALSTPVSSQSRDLSLAPSPTPYRASAHLPPTSSPSPALHDDSERPHPRVGNHDSPGSHVLKHALAILILLTLFTGVTFLILRHVKLLCASPRCRASRLASREERRNRRAYRQAARRHAWRSWWNRYRHPKFTKDYDEKRTLILEQEAILEDAMQDEIRGIRIAQQVIGDMTRAEEGRSQFHHQTNTPQQRAELEAGPSASSSPPPASPSSPSPTIFTLRSSNLQDYQTQIMLLERQNYRHVMARRGQHNNPPTQPTLLPSTQPSTQPQHYQPHTKPRRPSSASSHSTTSSLAPPPLYEQELEGEIAVVDGFMYSPTFGRRHTPSLEDTDGETDDDGAVDVSPDSSVVDCSPRMSFDTGRTTLTSVVMKGKGDV